MGVVTALVLCVMSGLLSNVEPATAAHRSSTTRIYRENNAAGSSSSSSSSFAPMAALPPLLRWPNGSTVHTQAEWAARRSLWLEDLQKYITGTIPTTVPDLVRAETVNTTTSGGVRSTFITLYFATVNNASFTLELLQPMMPMSANAAGALPLFMTQTNHRLWALIAVSRGYAGCVYPAADALDQSDVFKEAYPHASWGLIIRRAWLGMRALDYLVTRTDIDPTKVGVTGHSRNGKQSLLFAAFDPRITSVISSSAGAPIATPYRFSSAFAFGETATDWGPSHGCCFGWWLDSMRRFAGHENQLPVDGHAVLAAIAPRHLMLYSAWTDDASDIPFAVQRSLSHVEDVYTLFGTGSRDRVRSVERPGNHHGFLNIHELVDWFDYSFGIMSPARGGLLFPRNMRFVFDWEAWQHRSNATLATLPHPTEPLADRVQWLMGQPIPRAHSAGIQYGYEWVYISSMLQRLPPGTSAQGPENLSHGAGTGGDVPAGISRIVFTFGRAVWGTIFIRTDLLHNATSIPSVVWLHPYSYHLGFSRGGYAWPRSTHQLKPYFELAKQGYLVMSFDQIGFGTRINEGPLFYERYPLGSKLGFMVGDVSAAVDVLSCLRPGQRTTIQCVNPEPVQKIPATLTVSSITVVGYSMGALVGLHAAAFDQRVDGLALFSGISPLRNTNATSQTATGSLERLASWQNIIPKLGLFRNGKQDQVPYELLELVRAHAPKPLLAYTPQHDRNADHQLVQAMLDKAAPAWGAQQGGFARVALNTTNQWTPLETTHLLAFLNQHFPTNG